MTDENQDYRAFLATKRLIHHATGREVADSDIHPMLFPFQRDLTRWAIRKGRAALFAVPWLAGWVAIVVWLVRLVGGMG